jgi:hypothetical protein
LKKHSVPGGGESLDEMRDSILKGKARKRPGEHEMLTDLPVGISLYLWRCPCAEKKVKAIVEAGKK